MAITTGKAQMSLSPITRIISRIRENERHEDQQNAAAIADYTHQLEADPAKLVEAYELLDGMGMGTR